MKKFISFLALLFCCSVAYTQPGELDSSFGDNGIVRSDFFLNSIKYRSVAQQILLQPDGNMYSLIGFRPRRYPQRGLPIFIEKRFRNGALDLNFASNGYSGPIKSRGPAALQSDGKIVVGGSPITRYNTNGSLDISFSNDGKQMPDFGVKALAIQKDGKIVVAGDIEINDSDIRLARYNTDGSPDSSFADDGNLTIDFESGSFDYVSSLAIQNDGKIVVVGNVEMNSYFKFGLTRYNTDGSLDYSFSEDGKQITEFESESRHDVSSVTIQNDGKIVVVGNIGETTPKLALARYNTNGNLDATFSEDGMQITDFGENAFSLYEVWSIAIQIDGKIIVAANTFLTRFNTDGSLDQSFNKGGKVITNFLIASLNVETNGTILVSGANGFDFNIARYSTNGSLDVSLDGDGIITDSLVLNSGVTNYSSIALQSDGKVLTAGYTLNGSNYDFALARYSTDGNFDSSFSEDGKQTTDLDSLNDYGREIALQNNGKIIMAGTTGLLCFHPNGSLDKMFSEDGKLTTDFEVTSIAIQKNGKIIAAGGNILVQYTQEGALDKTFSEDGKLTTDFEITSIAIQQDEKMIIAGNSFDGNTENFALARYNQDGSPDNNFSDDGIQTTNFIFKGIFGDQNAWDKVGSLAIQSDGKIVVAGSSQQFSTEVNYIIFDFALARYNTDGSLDSTFNTDGLQTTDFGGDEHISSIDIQIDGKIVAAGETTIARFNNDGSLDSSFSEDGKQITANNINSLAIAQNKLYTVGSHDELSVKKSGTIVRYLLDNESTTPTVNITSPASSTTYVAAADIPLVAEATDPDGIRKIQFFNGNTLLATQNFFPYEYTWHKIPAGDYTFTAQLTNKKGIVTTSEPVQVKVLPNQLPAVSITNPATNAIYTAPAAIRLVADASDPDGIIKKVQFYNGATLIATQNYFPYELTWHPVAAGDYTFTAKAIDDKGGTTTSDIVKVSVVASNNLMSNAGTDNLNKGNGNLFSINSINLKVSPVPVKNMLNIYTTGFPQNKKITISVVSVSGIVIKTIQKTSGPTMQIDVSSLKPGTYTLKAISGDKTLFTRFVKL